MTVNDACEDTQVIGNYIAHTESGGIQAVNSGYNDLKNILIANNTVRSTKGNGINANGTAIKGLRIQGNYIYNQADDIGYAMPFGILVDSVDRAEVSDNTVVGATTTDILLQRCTLLVVGQNTAATISHQPSFPNTYLTAASTQSVSVGGDYTVVGYEDILECWGATATHAITLPAAASYPKRKRLTIKDVQGAAGSYTITITPNGAETIDGAATLTITTNYGKATIYTNGTTWYTA